MWASLVAKGGKESTSNAEDLGSIPGLGRALGVGNDYLLQYSCLENSMDREAWLATTRCLGRVGGSPPRSVPSVRGSTRLNNRTPGHTLTFPKRCDTTMSGRAWVHPEIWEDRSRRD